MNARALYERLNCWLAPLALPYAGLMRLRREFYSRGLLRVYRPACFCIAVGNIAFGGSGKSPLVSWLLEKARRDHKRAVVLSRGYGGKPGKLPLIVKPDTPVALAGDEPLMLAQKHPEAFVVVHPKRALGAALAEKDLAPDWLILDDGMQHLAVERGLNLVLLRPEDLRENWSRVIPSGPWREGPFALSWASAFLVRCTPEEWNELTPDLQKRLGSFGKAIFSFFLAPLGLRPLTPGEKDIRPGPYALLSGVARNDDVARDATRLLGKPPLRHFTYADHHAHTLSDALTVAHSLPPDAALVCTAKDAVKLAPHMSAFGQHPVLIMESEIRFGPALYADSPFEMWLDTKLAAKTNTPSLPINSI
ncbi:tetraacyldisaccharide 4'-kinase [Desulfovibrio sp. OttesenSCG-928-M14]|nr:tetraacyldisaccharide 4'-kinase [Desulfovibrio sp. OttesenSCG-928-M14]